MRILFVENHPEFTAMVVARFFGAHDVIVVPTIAEAKQRIGASTFDVALVDYDLDDGKGDTFVRWIRSSGIELKLVAVSARDQGNDALIAAGADVVCAKIAFGRILDVLDDLLRG